MKHPIFHTNLQWQCNLPNKLKTENWVDDFFYWLYSLDPNFTDLENFLSKEEELKQILIGILDEVVEIENAQHITKKFFEELPMIHEKLEEDLEVFYAFDPAAKSKSEILLSYPGFFAVTFYRISSWFWKEKVVIIPRVISEYVHSKTGIDIHPGAKIGRRFFIDHGTGIVIGETAEIGEDIKIYQGVTLGALSVSKDKAEQKRHPTIGNNVIIYANATILGGETKIGDNSTIGGNVWITNSIPEYSMVYHKSEAIIKNNKPFPEPINFVI